MQVQPYPIVEIATDVSDHWAFSEHSTYLPIQMSIEPNLSYGRAN